MKLKSTLLTAALAGSVLASGMAAAALQDHGPADPALGWPLWYRDLNESCRCAWFVQVAATFT